MSTTGHKEFELASASELRTLSVGRAMAHVLQEGDVVALVGSLGAGKTQLVRGIAAGMNVNERLVSSPTFVLMHEYPGTLPVVHIDAYRLSDPDELETIGWSPELLEGAVTLIEWADRMTAELPRDYLQIDIEHTGEHERLLRFTGYGTWADRMVELRHGLEQALKTVACPTCSARVAEEAETFPFCSPRCRMADLNKWFEGEYRISRPLDIDDLENQS